MGGRYRLLGLIGQGAVGAVYVAEHERLRKKFAIKVLHSEWAGSAELLLRFEREALAASHIEHPNVAAAVDFGTLEDGAPYIAFEYVAGDTLREALVLGAMDPQRASLIIRQIASALAAAHSQGIVHRDLKPENAMLVDRGDGLDFVKVLDFGVAKVPMGAGQKAGLTQRGMVYGTPEYMAPEQALGEDTDARADLYALGVIYYELLTGRRPFDHEDKVVLCGMHLTAPVPPTRNHGVELAEPVERLVLELLAKPRANRVQTALDVVRRIDAIFLPPLPLGADISGAFPSLAPTPRPPPSLRAAPPSHAPTDRDAEPSAAAASMRPRAELAAPGPEPSQPIARRLSLATPPALASPFPRRDARVVRPWMVALGAVGVGAFVAALAFGGGILLRGRDSGAARAPSSAQTAARSASAISVLASSGPTAHLAALAKARECYERGEFECVMAETEPFARTHDFELQRLRLQALMFQNRLNDAIETVRLMGKARAEAALDPFVVDYTDRALGDPSLAPKVLELLATEMGEAGVDRLFDIAHGPGAKRYGPHSGRARTKLMDPLLQKRASPALRAYFEIESARSSTGCEQLHAALENAKKYADHRSLPLLLPYESKTGCGPYGRDDCFARCLRQDSLLADTISAIRARSVDGGRASP